MNKVSRLLIRFVFTAAMLVVPALGLASATERPDEETRLLLKDTIEKANSFKDRFEAEVWLVDMDKRLSRYVEDPEERLKILHLVHTESYRFELKPEMVLAVMHVESLFDRYIGSRDRCCSCATISLDHITIYNDSHIWESRHVHNRTQ